MNNLQELINSIKYVNIINSLIIVIASIIVYKFCTYIFNKSEKNVKNKKSKTYIKVMRSTVRYFFIIITVLILLQANGVDVSSLLAGVGIAGAIIGLAVQDWLKDIIRGSTILSDSYFTVGDVVKFGDIEGKVIEMGLKTTKIQDLATCNILSVANRNIEQIEKVSNLVYVSVPMPYEVNLKKAENVVLSIAERIKENDGVSDCRYISVKDLASSCIEYLLEIQCDQIKKRQVRRDAYRSILEVMEKNGIAVPYMQIDIHNK
ncbi:MAG: mechanosensitive ion channel family protein [Clostridia bacterium]|nr:mechanosensitive ion channel family protein [Clostridia bacterium]